MLLHAARYLKDNRIPPQGFTTIRADLIEAQTRLVGIDDDGDFNIVSNEEGSGSDTVHYRVSVNAADAACSVKVRLLYQSIQPGFIDGLQGSGGLVNSFKQMVAQRAPAVEVLATASVALSAAGIIDGDVGDVGNGTDDGGSGGGCALTRVTESYDPLLPVLWLLAVVGLLCQRVQVVVTTGS